MTFAARWSHRPIDPQVLERVLVATNRLGAAGRNPAVADGVQTEAALIPRPEFDRTLTALRDRRVDACRALLFKGRHRLGVFLMGRAWHFGSGAKLIVDDGMDAVIAEVAPELALWQSTAKSRHTRQIPWVAGVPAGAAQVGRLRVAAFCRRARRWTGGPPSHAVHRDPANTQWCGDPCRAVWQRRCESGLGRWRGGRGHAGAVCGLGPARL